MSIATSVRLDSEQETWAVPGTWTWEDYVELPQDGNRYEIIEGTLYVSPAPIYDHQFVVTRLALLIGTHLLERAAGEVLVAPFDVRLPGIGDPVQPDLVAFVGDDAPRSGDANFRGVPALVIEVLSPGSVRYDTVIKHGAYEKAGIPEYWIVDPVGRRITVHRHDPDTGRYRELGRFGDGDELRSAVLEGLRAPVATVFPS